MKLFTLWFLPLTIVAFHLLRRYGPRLAAPALLLASLAFYSVADLRGLPLFLCSIVFNYWITGRILRSVSHRTAWSAAGVVLNLLPLLFYKYVRAAPAQDLSSGLFVVAGIPLGLSFYTFQQITCLFDIQRPGAVRLPFTRHALFAGFFAQIPAGPVSKYRDLAPQMSRLGFEHVTAEQVLAGVSLFVFGLAKKMFVADNIGSIVDPFHALVAAGQHLSLIEAWLAAWGFLLQMYFDFSGYSDMAIGAAMCFGLTLPINFNSPLKSLTASDFVGRWHMSLVGWIREYLYQPLFQLVRRLPMASNQHKRILGWAVATVASMTVIGAWHGRQLALLLEGLFGGIVLVLAQLPSLLHPDRAQHDERSFFSRLRRIASRIQILAIVSVLVLALRASSMKALLAFLRSMVDLRSLSIPLSLQGILPGAVASRLHFGFPLPHIPQPRFDEIGAVVATLMVLTLPNTMQIFGLLPGDLSGTDRTASATKLVWRPTVGWGIVIGCLAVAEIVFNGRGAGTFIYANF